MDQVRSASPVQIDLAGMQVPLHCGSVGKLYLSTLSDEELDAYLKQKLPALTRYTHNKPSTLRSEILEARTSGLAYNYKEHREEWCGISAAIRDRAGRVIAYLNVTLPTFNHTEAKLRSFGPVISSAATEISTLFARSAI